MFKHEMENGTKLLLVDNLDPEDLAMVQALYSRSPESAEVHLAKVKETGSGKFMSRFYTGYNHKSIADCGDTTFFVEGVSMLAAKAIQDWPLYSGQETSTRYIDMSRQRIEDPVKNDLSGSILSAWMNFYTKNQDRVSEQVRRTYPKGPDEQQSHYDGAVKARTFDILRGFLPAGITTQLSWHTNLRQAGEHIAGLLHHPSAEIRAFSRKLAELFHTRYQATGTVNNAGVSGVVSDVDERESWVKKVAEEFTYSSHLHFPRGAEEEAMIFSTLNQNLLHRYQDILASRPRGCVLPHFLLDVGQLTYSFLLDFGSFRDIQRHRNGVCRMPLLTTKYGFHPWYLDQLDEELRGEALGLIARLEHDIVRVSKDPVVRQYYTAFGFRVPTQVTYGLPAAIYVMEIRSGKTVHPTLRLVMQESIKVFEEMYPKIKLHVDRSTDDWTVRRGTQTITEKTL